MRKFLLVFLFGLVLSCAKTDTIDSSGSSGSTGCGTYTGRTLYKGPQGGCYYINSSGNKEYVDRSNCRC